MKNDNGSDVTGRKFQAMELLGGLLDLIGQSGQTKAEKLAALKAAVEILNAEPDFEIQFPT
jgi:hypothetical protein